MLVNKKVLIFSLAYYPHVGGAEVAIKEITDRLSDIKFHMVTLRFGSEPKEEKIGNVLVHRVGFGVAYTSKILFIPLAALTARSLHKKYNFDSAWAMMSYMLLPLKLANIKVPYALTLQEGDTYEHMFKRLHILPVMPLIKSGFKGAGVVQVISTYLGIWAHKMRFTGPVEVIPNGVDTKRFHGSFPAHEGTVLITTSRLVRKNGIDTIIKALPLLPDVRLHVVGAGPDEADLQALSRILGVQSRVEFSGYVDHAKLPEALFASDIFIRPSRSEGMGNSFIEAMAAGLPVIATQVGGISDFLFDAKRNPDKAPTGWAVDVDSPQQIAEAVKEILGNPGATRKVIENARKMAQEKYDWDLIARNMKEKVFERLLKH